MLFRARIDHRSGYVPGSQGLETNLERDAVEVVRAWLVSQGHSAIRVDDENGQPSYALEHDDEGALDTAIGWLPKSLFHNPTTPAWNPVVRLAELAAIMHTHDVGVE